MYRFDEDIDQLVYQIYPERPNLQEVLNRRSVLFLWAFLASESVQQLADHATRISNVYNDLSEQRLIFSKQASDELDEKWMEAPRLRVTLEMDRVVIQQVNVRNPETRLDSVTFLLHPSGAILVESTIAGWSPIFTRDPRSVDEARKMAKEKIAVTIARLAEAQYALVPELRSSR